MASAITLPSAPNTGLTSLANVLLSSASEYAGQKRSDQTEARRRAERLADIESERAYSETNYSRGRKDRLSDIQSDRDFLLSREETARDNKLTDVADQRFWEKKVREQGGEEAQQRLNQLTENEAAVMARMDARQKRLSTPEPMPTRGQVESRALAIARMSSSDKNVRNGKTPPPTGEIEAAIPQAVEEARAVLNQAWQRDRLDAQEEQRIDAVLINRIGTEKNVITNIFRKVGLGAVEQAPPASPTSAAPPTDPRAAQLAIASGLLTGGKVTPTAAPVPPPSTLSEPGMLFDSGGGANAKRRISSVINPVIDSAAYVGESLGSSLSDIFMEGEKRVEDTILREQPNSDRAKSIRARRGLPPSSATPLGVTPLQSVDGRW